MFPCDAERIGHIDESIGIVKSPSESFYAILCGNSIRILDARDRCFPEIAFLETGSETKNHWILWPSETRIVFGTYTGKVCVLRFEKETLEVLLEKPFPSVITSVFASHDKQICLILTGPKFVCMDLNGVIQTNVALPKAFGIIKNAWEVSKGVFGFESNRGWILYDLNKKTSQKIGVESYLKCFGDKTRVACVSSKGSVSLYNITTGISTELLQLDGSIDSLYFTSESDIVVIGFGGKVVSYNFLLKRTFSLSFEGIQDATTSIFDGSARRVVILSANGDLTAISFGKIVPPFIVTAFSLIRVDDKQAIAEVPDFKSPLPKRIRSIPPELYPIQNVAPSSNTCCCISGKAGLAVLTEYSLFFDSNPCALHVVWINNMVCVVDKSGVLILYTHELLKIGEMKLAKMPVSLHVQGTKLLLAARNEVSIFHFGEKGQVKIGSIEISIKTISVNHSIVKAFLLWKNIIFIEKDDHSVVDITNGKTVWKHCDFVWSGAEPLSLLSLREEHGVTVLTETKTARFPNIRSLWSWQTKLFDISSDASTHSIDFDSRLIPIGASEPNDICKAMQSMIGQEDFKESFLHLLDQNPNYTDLSTALRQIDMLAVPQFLDLMSDGVLEKLSNTGFDFTPFFAKVKPSIQSRILNRIQPRFFNLLVDQHQALLEAKEDRFKRFVIGQCVERRMFIRGVSIARASNVNFGEALESSKISGIDFDECLKAMKNDSMVWNCEDRLEKLELLTTHFERAGLFNWAFAALLVLKDENHITALLNNEPQALMYAINFTREHSDDELAAFLRALDFGI